VVLAVLAVLADRAVLLDLVGRVVLVVQGVQAVLLDKRAAAAVAAVVGDLFLTLVIHPTNLDPETLPLPATGKAAAVAAALHLV
jgi:hypothetical protein